MPFDAPTAVLLVEDNPGDARLIIELLREDRGGRFDLHHVAALAPALRRLAEAPVHVVLLDLSLPDSQGAATFARMKSAAPEVPIIVLTGFGDESLALRMVRNGAQDYLVKGDVDSSILGRAIRYAIERQGADSAIRGLNDTLERRVTERTAELEVANAEVSRRERELQEYIDAMSTLNAKVAPDGTILLVNRAAQQASGTSLEALLRTSFVSSRWWAGDVDVQDRVRSAFDQACGGTSVSYVEKLRGSGQVLTMLLSLVPIAGGDGDVAYIVAEGQDISRRIEAEESLMLANRELEAFTYSVSHDLRAPLRQIDGFSRILSERAGSALEPESRHYLSRIQEGTQHMGRLVDDLLALARLGQQEPRVRETSLDSMVRDLIADLEPEQEGRAVEWRIGDLPIAACDPGLMRIAFSNLLSNALKYTRPRALTTIEVGSVVQADGRPVVFVRDNGVGFNMKYADKLFGVFQRLHRAEEFEGTGVGLAIVQRIIRKHGGELWAEAAPDAGATFYFTVGAPASAAAEGA